MQVKKFDEAAARFFEKLARAGNAVAQFYMGRLAAMGTGVQKDMPKAVASGFACQRDGLRRGGGPCSAPLFAGTGVAQTTREAARWSRLAADQGHGGAAYNLARIYVKGGAGLAADPAEAEKWGKIAMAKGLPDPFKDPPPPEAHGGGAGDLRGRREALHGRRHDARGADFRRCASWATRLPGAARRAFRGGQGRGEEPRGSRPLVPRRRRAAPPRRQYNLGNMRQPGAAWRRTAAPPSSGTRAPPERYPPGLYGFARMYQYGFGVKEDRAQGARALSAGRRARQSQGARGARHLQPLLLPDRRPRHLRQPRERTWARSTAVRPGEDTRPATR